MDTATVIRHRTSQMLQAVLKRDIAALRDLLFYLATELDGTGADAAQLRALEEAVETACKAVKADDRMKGVRAILAARRALLGEEVA